MLLIDLNDPAVPHLLRHSYGMALHDAVSAGQVPGFARGEIQIDGVSVPASVAFEGETYTQWRAAWLGAMQALELPAVATIEALQQLPHLTPGLLTFLHQRPAQTRTRPRPSAPRRPPQTPAPAPTTPPPSGEADPQATPHPGPAAPGAAALPRTGS